MSDIVHTCVMDARIDWELAGRIRDHQAEGKAIAERLKEQGPLVIDRLLNFFGHKTSLRQLARDAGCSAMHLSRIHRGHCVISLSLFALLSDLLQDRTQRERLTARDDGSLETAEDEGFY